MTPSCTCRQNNHVSQTEDVNNERTDTEDISSVDSTENYGSRNPSVRGGSGSRSLKRDSALKDQQSTGRKRAARMYPLDRNAPCEWRNKANCGGGPYPIVGCITGLQEARHHGPDKSTSNNDEGNVHRICHYCHANWHAKNNIDYDWNSTKVNQHKPRPATKEEKTNSAVKEMIYKNSKKKVKIKD